VEPHNWTNDGYDPIIARMVELKATAAAGWNGRGMTSLAQLRRTGIGAFVGQRSLSVTADTYTYVLTDETELEYAELLGAARA
jgi:hypothetical protein